MRPVTDTAGRTWLLRLDVAAARRVRAVAGLDLLDLDAAVVSAVVADPLRLADVLYAACLPQADARGLARGDFDRALSGRALDDGGAALLGAVNDALPSADDLRHLSPREARPPGPTPSLWQTVYQLAARVGVDPSAFTLRELVWASEEAGRDAWNHTAAVIAGIANQMPFRGKAKPLDPLKLNPYTRPDLPAAPKPAAVKVGPWALRSLFCRT